MHGNCFSKGRTWLIRKCNGDLFYAAANYRDTDRRIRFSATSRSIPSRTMIDKSQRGVTSNCSTHAHVHAHGAAELRLARREETLMLKAWHLLCAVTHCGHRTWLSEHPLIAVSNLPLSFSLPFSALLRPSLPLPHRQRLTALPQ